MELMFMADPDIASRFARRVEIALQDGFYDLAHRIIDEAELEFTTPADLVTLDTSLAAIDVLPVRVVNMLERHGIHTVGDALSKTPDQLRQIANFGEHSVQTLIETLRRLPIATGDD
jgi:DNA-directed RNA polymerase alpha subunit